MFERYYKDLLNFMSQNVGDRDKAADIVQETYFRFLQIQASQNRNAIREPKALLFKIAKNIAIDMFRRDQVREAEDIESADIAMHESSQPDFVLDQQQQILALSNAIESLPARCKEAFILFKFDNLPQSEIAIQMGISQNMVEKHIIRAMIVCKRAIEHQG